MATLQAQMDSIKKSVEKEINTQANPKSNPQVKSKGSPASFNQQDYSTQQESSMRSKLLKLLENCDKLADILDKKEAKLKATDKSIVHFAKLKKYTMKGISFIQDITFRSQRTLSLYFCCFIFFQQKFIPLNFINEIKHKN